MPHEMVQGQKGKVGPFCASVITKITSEYDNPLNNK